MDKLLLMLIFDSALLIVLVGLLAYHVRFARRERRKTEQIQLDLEQEREKTNKFHVSVEEIRRMTKG